MLVIPFRDASRWQMQIELTGQQFSMVFSWNALNEFWVMDILDRNDSPLIYGIKIVQDFLLLEPYTVTGKPLGNIVCQNIVNSTDSISRYDMNQKFQLVYYEPGELESILQETA